MEMAYVWKTNEREIMNTVSIGFMATFIEMYQNQKGNEWKDEARTMSVFTAVTAVKWIFSQFFFSRSQSHLFVLAQIHCVLIVRGAWWKYYFIDFVFRARAMIYDCFNYYLFLLSALHFCGIQIPLISILFRFQFKKKSTHRYNSNKKGFYSSLFFCDTYA